MNGLKVKLMATACISGKMVIDLKESGNFVSSMGKAQICLQTVMSIQVSIQMVNHTVSGSTSGKTHQFTLGSSEVE